MKEYILVDTKKGVVCDMDGFILLIVIAVCVILLVMISKKRKELRDMYERERESGEFIVKDLPKTPGKTKSDPVDPGPTSTIKSKQMTIYEYQSWTRTRVCRQCDGESAMNADRCGICGMPF